MIDAKKLKVRKNKMLAAHKIIQSVLNDTMWVNWWCVGVHKQNEKMVVIVHWAVRPGIGIEWEIVRKIQQYLNITALFFPSWHPFIKTRKLYYMVTGSNNLKFSPEITYGNLWSHVRELKKTHP